MGENQAGGAPGSLSNLSLLHGAYKAAALTLPTALVWNATLPHRALILILKYQCFERI